MENLPRKVRTYRDLIAWQKGMELARMVYPVIRRMPAEERFALADQMWRAAYSVPSNIAEGYARQSRQDYLKFLRIARGSLAELSTQFELATSLHIVQANRILHDLIEEEDRVLQGLIRSIEHKLEEQKQAKSKTRKEN